MFFCFVEWSNFYGKLKFFTIDLFRFSWFFISFLRGPSLLLTHKKSVGKQQGELLVLFKTTSGESFFNQKLTSWFFRRNLLDNLNFLEYQCTFNSIVLEFGFFFPLKCLVWRSLQFLSLEMRRFLAACEISRKIIFGSSKLFVPVRFFLSFFST